MSVSCVCASESDGAAGVDGLNADLNVSADGTCGNLDSYSVTVDDGGSDSVAKGGTFDNLDRDIRNLYPGDTYNMDRDYHYDEADLVPAKYGIIVNVDNVVINGNGHVIDGGNKSALFSVYGNNVRIFNLTFMNACYCNPEVTQYDTYSVESGRSPVHWEGDKGVISNCIFIGNSALKMGGQ